MVKNLPANTGDTGNSCLIPGLERSPGGGDGNPIQGSCLENPMDRGAWRATVHGDAMSWTRLSEHTRYDLKHALYNPSCLTFVKTCCLSVSAATLAPVKKRMVKQEEGAKEKEKQVLELPLDCTHLVEDGVMDEANLGQFLQERIKVKEKLGILVEGLLQPRETKARLL